LVNERETLILYTTAVCNLKCVYCYIDKNEALKKIDTMLDESFQGDYYFNFAKKMFPNRNQLKRLEIWGGEPTIRLDRCFETVEKLIEYYPNLYEFNFSTNFTGSHWFDQFFGFCDIFRKFPNRKFHLFLQMSIDGPTELNDSQRGKGVTRAFTEHFKQFVEYKKEDKYPHNLIISSFFKPTLSSYSIPLLQTKEAIIEYYRFFEKFKDMIGYYEDEIFDFGLTIPNTACPSPHTKEEGIMFANLCRLCREIEKENLKTPIFKHYKAITPLAPRDRGMSYQSCPNVADGCGHCGMASRNIGLLPNNRLSLCHNGFVDLISDYKIKCMDDKQLMAHNIDSELFNRNLDIRDTNCSLEEFETYEKIVDCFKHGNHQTFQLSQLMALIIYLAKGDLIDSKYQDPTLAIEAGRFIQNATSYCIRDNLGSTGSSILYPMGLIKLLLNGAKEYCEDVAHLE
jgi:hypothetical protein